MHPVRQVIAYKIKPSALQEFDGIKQKLIEEAYDIPGLISSETSCTSPEENLFMDTMMWQSQAHCDAAPKFFEKLPTTGQFFSLMEGPPVFQGIFERTLTRAG